MKTTWIPEVMYMYTDNDVKQTLSYLQQQALIRS